MVNFLGADPNSIAGPNLHAAKTLEDAAQGPSRLPRETKGATFRSAPSQGPSDRSRPASSQRYVRGLYSGGTFCYEASLLLSEILSPVYSNTPVGTAQTLGDVWQSRAHTLIDLGDDIFTRGRPHPMIDHRLRNERIAKEANDPATAVILLDVVLGYGAHIDPTGEIAPVVSAAKARAAKAGRDLIVLGFVCGTESDPQNLGRQKQACGRRGCYWHEATPGRFGLPPQIAKPLAREMPAAMQANED